MKKKLLLAFLFFIAHQIYAADIFKPVQDINLRAPAVPLITSDPYLSIWSPYNNLTEGDTEHWTGESHPLIGAIRVDSKVYRFLGEDKSNMPALAPMTSQQSWNAKYTFDKPAETWKNLEYDDAAWKSGAAAFGTEDYPRVGTKWDTKDIWVRRTFNLPHKISDERVILQYSHDDILKLYLNGELLLETAYTWNTDVQLELSDSAKKKLRKGENIIAAHCHNKTGGAYLDLGLYHKIEGSQSFENVAIQKSVNVLPTQSYYTFECGPVELDIVFTAPLLLNDLDLVSTPINYISYRARSLDNKKHDVQLYIETTPQLAVNDISQAVKSYREERNNFTYLKTGTINQPYTKRTGDGVRIDWGHAYLASPNSDKTNLILGDYFKTKQSFASLGTLPASAPTEELDTNIAKQMTVLAYTDNLGSVDKNGSSGYLMIGYDDIYSIEYFFERKKAYWKHDDSVTIYDAFERASKNYDELMLKSRTFDKQLMTDAEKAGGKEYAELCALAYRQSITAHKLLKDNEGNILFLSKENHSNGCINTVDVTYPSAPLYLIYNPELLKGMLTGIFYYSESGRWNKPYPSHDLGTYPVANGQLYGEDMPIEEAGNMILLTAAISRVEGNAEYARKHWETLTTWANYLVEYGLDPENQLCTDDFAGHLAHNANLSIKAIMAIAGYGEMAKMLGKDDIAQRHISIAKEMAVEWEKMANDGDYYKLAFDKPGTWSQKYNLVWDKIFNMNIFPSKVIDTEIPFYLSKINKYGLPLDSRKTYTKSDWIVWTACLAKDDATFRELISPVYKYANETTSRVAISDWHDTFDGKMQNFKARSVVGGYFMKLLESKIK